MILLPIVVTVVVVTIVVLLVVRNALGGGGSKKKAEQIETLMATGKKARPRSCASIPRVWWSTTSTSSAG